MIDHIKILIQKIIKKRTGHAVLVLASGTAVSQLITVLAAPILTRLYSPETFGQYGVFLSLSSILSVLSIFGYDSAIILSDDKEEITYIVLLNIILCVTSSIFIAFFIFFIKELLNIYYIKEFYDIIIWIPLYILILGLTIINTKYLIWIEYYKKIRKAKISQESSTIFFQIALSLSWTNKSLFLCLGRLLGTLMFLCISTKVTIRHLYPNLSSMSISKLQKIALKYYQFPKYTLFSALLAKANVQLIPLIIYIYFGPVTSGLFILSQSIVNRPLSLIGESLQQVFYHRFSKACKSQSKHIRILFIKMSLSAAFVTILPATAIFIFAPLMISVIFGPEWEETGVYLRILVPALTAKFIVSATSLSMYTLKKNRFVLIWSGIFLCLASVGLWIGFLMNNTFIGIGLLSVVNIIMYIIYYIFNLIYIDQYIAAEHIDNKFPIRDSTLDI